MDTLYITHADQAGAEIGYVDTIDKYDAQISARQKAVLEDNSYQLTIPDIEWARAPAVQGHMLYIAHTEWGGPVEEVKHITASGTVIITGPTWRGMLMRKVIEPPAGEAYLTFSGDANEMLRMLIGKRFGKLFEVSTIPLGVSIEGSWRYASLYDGISKTLSQYDLTLDMRYDPALRIVHIGARRVHDYADSIDLSQDYGIGMRTTDGRIDAYNHIIALGKGELENRLVMHVFRLEDGTASQAPPAWAGTIDDMVATYDYSSAEDPAELLKGATERLLEYAPVQSIEVDTNAIDIDLQLGDKVSVRDRVTGLHAQANVTERILTIDSSGVKINTRIG